MSIVICNRCGTKVIPKEDGTCPSCLGDPLGTAESDKGAHVERPFTMSAPQDTPLPPRLDDPLAVARGVALLGIIGSVVSLGLDVSASAPATEFLKSCLGLLLSIFLFRTLPRSRTNAIYLRSFRDDRRTARLREAIQQGLGRTFRLSGIRAPRRRIPTFLKYAGLFVFCLRYATPRYMSLEAGDDWFLRLWRSLGDARCAFIDLSDLTEYVAQELGLVHRCLGPERVIFLGDETHDREGWRRLAAERLQLPADASETLRVVAWSRGRGWDRAAFVRTIGDFAAGLPSEPAAVNWSAYPAASTSGHVESRAAHLIKAVTGFLTPPLIVAGLPILLKSDWGRHALLESPFGMAVGGTLLALNFILIMGYVLFSSVTYYLDCGSSRERSITLCFSAAAGLLGLLISGGTLVNVQVLRESARRAQCYNNLKQVGLALANYETVEGTYPPAFLTDEHGRPIHSWRVLILPYLEERKLYKAYRFDEPWDGPNNRKLASRIPQVYRCPNDRSEAEGTTSYLGLSGRDAAFPGRRGVSPAQVVDGRDRTLCVVEAPSGKVNWLEPKDLDAEEWIAWIEARNAGRARGQHSHGSTALSFYGDVIFIKDAVPARVLRALTTLSGGEVIEPFRDY